VSEPQIVLLVGDTYRCQRALEEREASLLAADPAIERHVTFGDEVDPSSFGIELQSASLFALGRHFVVRQVDRCKTGKALAAAIEGEIPEGTYVSLAAESLRATNPVMKVCKGLDAVVSLPTPKGRGVQSTAKQILAERDIEAAPSALSRLVMRNGGDLLGIAQEARKLRSQGVTQLDETVVDRMVFPSAERTAYPFYDLLGERKLAPAVGALDELREDPGRLLGGALRHLARLAMIRVVLDQKGPRRRLSDAVGLPDWLCKRLSAQAKRFTLADLQAALSVGVSLDVAIKRGEIAPLDALLKLVVNTTAR